MNLPVLVLGGGGHAKVLINSLLSQSVDILGVTDPDAQKHGSTILGIPVIGGDDIVLKYSHEKILLINGLGSIKATTRRKQLYEHYKNLGYSFANVIHPSAVVAPDVKFQEGVQIMAGAIIQPGSSIGQDTIINTKTSIDHDCIIGDHVHLAPGVTLSGNVRVGNGVHVGTGATVIQGIRIENGSLIGAGAVVLRDVPEGSTVLGVPAKVTN